MPVKYGKLNDLSKFDAEFFGFHQPHRVNVMEPQSRIVLEKAYEALIDSGKAAGQIYYFNLTPGTTSSLIEILQYLCTIKISNVSLEIVKRLSNAFTKSSVTL